MTTMNIQQAMELAVARHRAGEFAQAEQIYRSILSQQPNNAGALHLLGLVTFQAGNLKAALDWITRAIALNPNVADYHLNQGVVLDAAGQTQIAVHAYRKALSLRPNIPEAHANLGNALRKLGVLDEAAAACRRALELRPDYFEAHLNLGNVLQDQGKLDEAIAAFEHAARLRPELAEAHHNLGNALARQQRFADAIAAQKRALRIKPDFAQAANALGVALRDKPNAADLDAAIGAFRQAVAAKPDMCPALLNLAHVLRQKAAEEIKQTNSQEAPAIVDEAIRLVRHATTLKPATPETHLEMGKLLQLKRDWDAAIGEFRQVIETRPDWAEAHIGLSSCLAWRGEWEAAIAAYSKTLSQNPDSGERYYSLGLILSSQGDYDGALAALRRAVSMRPDSVEMLTFLGATLCYHGEFDEATACIQRVLQLRPDYALGHWNMALLHLTHGRFAEGWKEYEWRWNVKELDLHFDPTAPLWDGGDLSGRRILLVAEQGIGDSIQCVRYVPHVAKLGGKIVLAVHGELQRLLEGVPPNFSDFSRNVDQWVFPDQNMPKYDTYCPLLTLPKVLGTTLENIPRDVPYLAADAGLKRKWHDRISAADALPSADGGLKVGIAWAGSPKHINDRNRSVPACELAPLAEASNARFYNLQKGPIAKPGVLPPLEMTDWTGELHDFADTAALMENLDLVICADTALAHLAGALGKRVWVLLPFLPDWRWLLNRTDSPWYPTMRLFRQPRPCDWSEPIAQIAAALKNL